MTDTQGLPARNAALRLLDAALRRGEPIDTAASHALKGLRPPDAGLARAIAAETLRWLTDIDALIDSATRQPLPDDAKARMILRAMLAQALRLETPAHAVIATGLPLLSGGPRRLAHGVFSTLMKEGRGLPEAPTLPPRVAMRWDYRSEGELAAISRGLREPPPLDLTLKNRTSGEEWSEKLGGELVAPGRLRLPRGTAVEQLEGFSQGAWWVQDAAASIPADLLGNGDGRRALDLCAAPGGKTMQLAAAGWATTALDISDRRLQRMARNLERTNLSANIVKADAMAWEPKEKFDAILIDAPCSATGTCRRHPEVLHRVTERQIAEFAEKQAAMLTRAADWLAPGGRLVYAVCSMEREEGEAIAEAFSALEPHPVAVRELPEGIDPNPDGTVRTTPAMWPAKGGIDGFFIARWSA